MMRDAIHNDIDIVASYAFVMFMMHDALREFDALHDDVLCISTHKRISRDRVVRRARRTTTRRFTS